MSSDEKQHKAAPARHITFNEDEAKTTINFLTGQATALKHQLQMLKNENYIKIKEAGILIENLRTENERLRSACCVWICKKCNRELYGKSFLDQQYFECNNCKSPCVPQRFLDAGAEPVDTETNVEKLGEALIAGIGDLDPGKIPA